MDLQNYSFITQDDELPSWVRSLRLLSLDTLRNHWQKIGLEMNEVDAALTMAASIKHFDLLRGNASSFLSFDFSPIHVRPELKDFAEDIGSSAADVWVSWIHGTYFPFLKQGAPSLELNKLAEILNGIESGAECITLQSNKEYLVGQLMSLFDGVIVVDDFSQMTGRDQGLFYSEGVLGSLSLEIYQLSSVIAYGNFWSNIGENLSDEDVSLLVNFVNSGK
jgi:hypothetical protein